MDGKCFLVNELQLVKPILLFTLAQRPVAISIIRSSMALSSGLWVGGYEGSAQKPIFLGHGRRLRLVEFSSIQYSFWSNRKGQIDEGSSAGSES
jgi:hypothetical protein